MSHEDAVQAITEAAAAEAAGDQAAEVAPPAPTEAPAPVEGAPENVVAPEPVQAPQGNTEPEPLVPFNPDELPEELIPAWKQMQSAFTPRLQEAAAVKRTIEELGGVESVQQAVELAQWMQNPDNWPTVYEQVYQAMEEAGFEFEDGSITGAPAPAGQPFDPGDDPELAPIVSSLRSLEQQSAQQQQLIEQFYAQQESQQQMAALELQQMQHLAEMQRQVAGIRQANPSYTDSDMKAVIELASFYNDDLLTAQARYESIVADRLSRYFEGKRAAGAATATQTPAGAGVVSHESQEPESLEDASAMAEELLRQMQAAGELDGF